MDNQQRNIIQTGEIGPKSPRRPKPKKKNIFVRILIRLFRFCLYVGCLGIIGGCVLAVMLSRYVVSVTEADAEVLDLDNQKMAMTSLLLAQDPDTGEWVEYSSFYSENHRIWVDINEVPENLKWAVICTEDKDFYQEKFGVNFKRTIAAAVNEYTPIKLFSSRQGASTLEQQLIKNITDDKEQDAMRKVREIFRAIGLSNRYSKEKVLEAYLNTVSLTGQMAGMEAGAQEYFGKSVSELSLEECATLAGITKNPQKYNPFTNPEDVLTRRNDILYFMWQQGKITETEMRQASDHPLVLVESQTAAKLSTATSNNSYFTDAVYAQLKQDLIDTYDYTDAEARNVIFNGGLRVYTTVNTDVQLAAENLMLNTDDKYFQPYWHEEECTQLLDEDIPVYEQDGVTLKTKTDADGKVTYYRKVRSQAALAVLDYDGAVKAIVGGIGEKTQDLSLNRATVPHQTGSTMKPIAAYCLALDYRLITYSTQINDIAFYSKADRKVLNTEYCRRAGLSLDPYNPNTLAVEAAWRDWPDNYSGPGTGSEVTIKYALANSLNTVAVWVGSYVGVDNMYSFVKDTLGLKYITNDDADLAPLVLGSQSLGLTSVELAGAYTMFNDGSYTTPHYYTRVETYDGTVVLDTANNLTTIQAIDPETATIMNRLLANVLTEGTAKGMKPAGEMDAVAKTGTTTDFRDFTFVGLTPYYVTAVWWGFDKPYSFDNFNVHSGKPTQQLWKDLMQEVQADLPYKEFYYDDNVIYRNGVYYTADNPAGASVGQNA